MEIETRSAAIQLGLSQRQVQRLAQNGRIVHRAVAGRTIVASRSLIAVSRSLAHGRHWSDHTVKAACDLLDNGSTEWLSGSQLSRLRARLRTMTIAELSYQVLGNRVSLWRETQFSGTTVAQPNDGLSSTGESLTVTVTADTASYARRNRLLDDADGETLLVELETDSHATVCDIALYAYADERTSSAARARVTARQAAI